MASSTADGEDDEPVQEIRLVDDGEWWVATDVETGAASQGETRAEALENLDEAVALHRGEIGRPPADDELRGMGIDPEKNTTGSQEPPDVLD
ncbi:type II toxin-antitoxin system HicB family antitoxin [Halobacteriaceae archaeon SHR40]|uniref:type II toxin-antitoxin system HicB family antitoxin n=1 Tax=Halovenus amylolytica TaxID=2500550 RepID=UPI000FE32E8A